MFVLLYRYMYMYVTWSELKTSFLYNQMSDTLELPETIIVREIAMLQDKLSRVDKHTNKAHQLMKVLEEHKANLHELDLPNGHLKPPHQSAMRTDGRGRDYYK